MGNGYSITVSNQMGQPSAGLSVYAFDGNAYSGYTATTDSNGQSIFTLPQGSYHFRADYNSVPFWSSDQNDCTIAGCTSANITIPGGQVATDVTINYTYDPLSRLTAADYSDGGFYHYSYDAVGNRLTQQTQNATNTYTYDTANRLTGVDGVAYAWDANGNLLSNGTNTYTYDFANRLTAVSGNSNTISYAYNGLGDLQQETINGQAITYVNDLNANLTQVLSDGTNTYLYGVNRLAQTNGSDFEYFLTDALESVRQLTDQNGAVTLVRSYDPYGNVIGSLGSETTTYGFAGELQDSSTNLIDLRSRMYDPRIMMFVQPDTIVPDPTQPQDWNLYTYTRDNPVNYTDPSGHCTIGIDCPFTVPTIDLIQSWIGILPSGCQNQFVPPATPPDQSYKEIPAAISLFFGDVDAYGVPEKGSLGLGTVVGDQNTIVTANHVYVSGYDNMHYWLDGKWNAIHMNSVILNRQGNTDLLTIKLSQALPSTFVPIAAANDYHAKVGDPIDAIYQDDPGGKVPGAYHVLSTFIFDTNASTNLGVGYKALNWSFILQEGDSGGGAFYNGQLIGVNSGVYPLSPTWWEPWTWLSTLMITPYRP